MVMLGDGFNFMEVEFKKEAVNTFKKDYSHLTFNELRDRIVYITAWSLKLCFRDSNTTLNSFENLSIVLVVEKFKPIMTEAPLQRQVHNCTNVFADKEIRAQLENTRHQFVNSLLTARFGLRSKPLALGTFQMPKVSDLFTGAELKSKSKTLPQESTAPSTNRIAAAGLIRLDYDCMPDLNGVPTHDFNKY